MRILAFLLIVVGFLALVYGGIRYNREHTVLDVGPLHATATEKKVLPISPIVGGMILLGGVVLLVASRRTASA